MNSFNTASLCRHLLRGYDRREAAPRQEYATEAAIREITSVGAQFAGAFALFAVYRFKAYGRAE